MIRIGIIIVLLFCISCKEKERFSEYTDEQLIGLLFDLQLANTNVENGAPSSKDSLRELHLDQLSKIHSMSKAEIDSILKNLHFDNQRFYRITDSVVKRVEREINHYKAKPKDKNTKSKKPEKQSKLKK